MKVLLASFVLLLAALGALPAFGAPMTTITVKVTDLRGRPVEHADVIVRFRNNPAITKLGRKTKLSWEMRTNMEGVAKILPIPQGTIQIQVIAKNHQTFGENFEIYEEQKTVEIKLNPPQAQYSAH